jgi:Pacifastin inhibitor (LCMII)
MSSRSSRSFCASLSVLGLVAIAGCSSNGTEAPAEKGNIDSYESELNSTTPRYVGQIASGETKTNYYANPPKYRAFGFTARGGETITVDVKSFEGDAMAWITTTTWTALAANDDASSSTLDAKVVYKVPEGTPSRAYRIVFRDYDLLDATFTVKLSIDSGTVACTYGGKTYKPGDSFPSTDECNTCSCSTNGSVGCTKKACVCNPEAEPWRDYLGTPVTCQTIVVSCTTNKRPFQNACGCGCELLSH